MSGPVIIGPSLEELRIRARELVMAYFVAQAEQDLVPPTMRAKYVQKLAEATSYLRDGVEADLLKREAEMRGVPIQALAEMICAMAAPSDDMEIERTRLNLAIDSAEDHRAVLSVLRGAGIAYKARPDPDKP